MRHAMTRCGSPSGCFSSSRAYPRRGAYNRPIVGFAEVLFSSRIDVISHVSTLMLEVKLIYFSFMSLGFPSAVLLFLLRKPKLRMEAKASGCQLSLPKSRIVHPPGNLERRTPLRKELLQRNSVQLLRVRVPHRLRIPVQGRFDQIAFRLDFARPGIDERPADLDRQA